MEKFSVSVVVAVYNREKLLDRCVDSLVHQTLENVEIILVDDFSSDNSWDLMSHWKDQFPDKIQIMKSQAKGVAHAKNTGIQAARGEYIAFVDSDDWMDYKCLEGLYEVAEENNAQMVLSSFWKVKGKQKWKIGVYPKLDRPYTTIDYLEYKEPGYLHGKLIRKDQFSKYGMMPILRKGEDLAWLFVAFSYMDSIIYVDKPGYFYEIQEDSICSNSADPQIIDDTFAGSDHIIENVNPIYRDWAIGYTLNRTYNLKYSYVYYIDRFEAWIEEKLADLVDRPLETMPQFLADAILRCSNTCECIPKNIYLNGFGKKGTSPKIDGLEEIFGDSEPNCIQILDENTCRVDEACKLVQEAYENANYDFVGKYFAVKKCYENGGVFIDEGIVIDNPFNMLLKDPSFFGYESDDKFTDRVFGGRAGNRCFEKLLKTYEVEGIYEEKMAPLNKRIKTILIGMGNTIMMSSISKKEEYDYCTYPVDMFVYSLPYAENSHVCHYEEDLFKGDTINIPISTLKSLGERRVRIEVDKVQKELQKQKQIYNKERKLSLDRSKYIAKVKKDLEETRAKSIKRSEYIADLSIRFEETRALSQKRSDYITELKEKFEETRALSAKRSDYITQQKQEIKELKALIEQREQELSELEKKYSELKQSSGK